MNKSKTKRNTRAKKNLWITLGKPEKISLNLFATLNLTLFYKKSIIFFEKKDFLIKILALFLKYNKHSDKNKLNYQNTIPIYDLNYKQKIKDFLLEILFY